MNTNTLVSARYSDSVALATVSVARAHPVRAAMLHVLCLFGLGVGGIAAIDGDDAIGVI